MVSIDLGMVTIIGVTYLFLTFGPLLVKPLSFFLKGGLRTPQKQLDEESLVPIRDIFEMIKPRVT